MTLSVTGTPRLVQTEESTGVPFAIHVPERVLVALVEQLLASDYRLFLKGPLLFNPDNFFGNTDNVFGGVGSFNLICLTKSHNFRLSNSIEITSPDDRIPYFHYD